jgi:hypothetical protein
MAPGENGMKTHYILIDYENVPVKSLALLKGDRFRVGVFLGPKNTRLATEFVLAMRELGEQGNYIQLEAGGPNALDFHIAFYLGRLLEARAAESYHIISKDKGFDALVAHVSKTGVACERADSIEAMSCWAKPVAAKATAAKNAAAKKTTPPAPSKATPATKKKSDELLALVVANLQKRATARPRTEKTLRSTVKTLIGAPYSDKELDAVLARLRKQGLVSIVADKLVYKLENDQ